MLKITVLPIETHQQVIKFVDDVAGLQAIIAIHSTVRGPALGGTRFWSYATEQDMLADALALSEAMTYKNAAAELPYGGGKAVINLNSVTKTPDLLKAYGEAVNFFNSIYITAEDVGCQPGDITIVSSVTPYCPKNENPSGGATAFGVLSAMIAAIKSISYYEISDASVVIQGVGNVGSMLCEMLVQSGAEVLITDTNVNKVNDLIKRFPSVQRLQSSSYLEPEVLHKKIKIFAPCALGSAIRVGDAQKMKAHYDIVCGAANNVVEDKANQELEDVDILYCPDFIANAGGVISIHHDIIGTTHQMIIAADIDRINSRMVNILEAAFINEITPMESALRYAKERIR